jgi:hypothetical protein
MAADQAAAEGLAMAVGASRAELLYRLARMRPASGRDWWECQECGQYWTTKWCITLTGYRLKWVTVLDDYGRPFNLKERNRYR